MNKFEMLLNELTRKTEEAKQTETHKQNYFGSNVGEQREIVIRYAIGREDEAKVYEGSEGEDGAKEDSYALLYATGNLLGKLTGIDGRELGKDLVKSALKAMTKSAMDSLFEKLEELFE